MVSHSNQSVNRRFQGCRRRNDDDDEIGLTCIKHFFSHRCFYLIKLRCLFQINSLMMTSSLGSVMMNWTSELVKQAKKKHKVKKIVIEQEKNEPCKECQTEKSKAEDAQKRLDLAETEAENLRSTMETLRRAKEAEFETKEAETTQLRYQIDDLNRRLDSALAHGAQNANVAHMDRAQLEAEIASLNAVLEMKCADLAHCRRVEEELRRKLERHYWLESELEKARRRVDEMSLVLENKMAAEKELMEMTEALTDDLAAARNEILALRREIENRKYLTDQEEKKAPKTRKTQKEDPSLVLDVREKTESVAWMLHIPDATTKI